LAVLIGLAGCKIHRFVADATSWSRTFWKRPLLKRTANGKPHGIAPQPPSVSRRKPQKAQLPSGEARMILLTLLLDRMLALV
jgi:hypothetical protein